MKINNDFVLRRVAGEAMLVPTGKAAASHNGLFMLTETAAFLWDKITDGVGEDLLAEKLTEEYDAEKDEAEEDVRAFLDRLQSFGIIDRGD